MSEDRIRLGQSLLQEAVYQSRARQAASVGLSGGQLDRPSTGTGAGCGLGQETAIDLELTERGEEVFREIWPRQLAPTEVTRIQNGMRDWVERQDALDRKRNHFLRDFRQSHGFDRRTYSDEDAHAFEAGLDRINNEVDERLRQAAVELLAEE